MIQLYHHMDTFVTTTLRRIAGFLRSTPPLTPANPQLLPAYAALARFRHRTAELAPRLRLLVSQLAAERSGCEWCIQHGRHQWREAQLPYDLLLALDTYATSRLYSEAERAALVFADALTCYADAAGGMPIEPLAAVRRHYSEPEVVALTETVAAMHFYNPITGALGADAAPRRVPVRPLPAPTAVRNLWL
jgi:alkylhydroperoxidase family enzyme